MRRVVMDAPGQVRVVEREDPQIVDPTEAVIRLTATCVCGSDLWPYRGVEAVDHTLMGHEYVGVVEQIGSQVKTITVGDFVVGSFVISDNTCEICQSGFQSKCVHAQFVHGNIGTQSEKARIPHADGTLVATPLQPGEDLISRKSGSQCPPTPGLGPLLVGRLMLPDSLASRELPAEEVAFAASTRCEGEKRDA